MSHRRAGSLFNGLVVLGMMGGAVAAGAQQAPASASLLAGCGADSAEFKTSHGELGDANPPVVKDEAAIYVIEDYLNDTGRVNRPLLRIGMDGTWVGAVQGTSYLRLSASPGHHHFCARGQSAKKEISLFNFEAEAGKTYYLRLQFLFEGRIDLQPVSEDEGRFLVSKAARSMSTSK